MILKVGSKGEDVKKLQQKLGLGTDGIVGEGTWGKMFPQQQLITEPSTTN